MSHQLNFSDRSSQLDHIMYPVAMQPILGISQKDYREVFTRISSRHNAIVNANTNEIISVVSNNYKLLPNWEALEMGKNAFAALFPSVKPESLVPFKVITPASKASCHIDLIHKDIKLSNTQWKQDNWYPFLRVTNSYNRTHAFSLEIGFVRELCSNGIIFKKETIKIKFNHDKLSISNIGHDYHKLKLLEHEFSSQLNKLYKTKFEKKFTFPMVCKALNLKFNTDSPSGAIRAREHIRLAHCKQIIDYLADQYFSEHGENAYAMLNVITDFVSHQQEYKCIKGFSINPNAYYRMIDAWSNNFTSAIEIKTFSMDEYLTSNNCN